ncbi:hypothetical protein DEO72_LG8g2012 [Vigna unguiculata]|uniref:Uncharacterized protein n=1 Tax=Vigna unguiculata TaxID=3917 RepID=A0A4D6MR23_VIGUN|nr:hypothetical protein DEO72_LG8g2012 [Vigna unguiculata]
MYSRLSELMLAWARLSFAQDKSASSRRRVPQNHRPSLTILLKREGLAWARRSSAQNNNQPCLREMFNQTTQWNTNSRLGKSHSPKRDKPSPKPQNPVPERWPRADRGFASLHISPKRV